MEHFFIDFNHLRENYHILDELVFNADETPLHGLSDKTKAICEKGAPVPIQTEVPKEENITLMLTINAVGESFSPTAILPLSNPPELSPSVLEYYHFAGSKKGYINQEIMKNWATLGFVQELEEYKRKNGFTEDQKALLILDNHGSRNILDEKEVLANHNVVLLSLPPDSSHLLQPLDLTVNLLFKKYYYQIHQFDRSLTTNQRRNQQLLDAKDVLTKALNPIDIKKAWDRCGLKTGDIIVLLSSKKLGNIISSREKDQPKQVTKKKRSRTQGSGAMLLKGASTTTNLNPIESESFQIKHKT